DLYDVAAEENVQEKYEQEREIADLNREVADGAGPSAWGNTQGPPSPDSSVAVSIERTTLMIVIRMKRSADGYTGA
ncbi:hypothetical protein SeLEV6574_g08395, partial [Synchytrium endobioticum]